MGIRVFLHPEHTSLTIGRRHPTAEGVIPLSAPIEFKNIVASEVLPTKAFRSVTMLRLLEVAPPLPMPYAPSKQ